ncbi:DEAD/DEAH box helicase [Methanotorris formicicus]|uniref:DEAD/DEAH box helicase domain protein n=1 Tax=Methanotorris formicicus Mc-S-70 TaxID=647171 RepID=H1L041_9EURY|nr:DEAD/DEAH box helicase [Methanotorris formicicus]EHP85261.1 DEAD/DEAH box helicase domain protein [Methanotorris formicicus Mc-S-70]
MLIIRKPRKKKDEIEVVDLVNEKKYYALLRKDGNKLRAYKCREEDKLIQPARFMNILKNNKILLSKDEETLKIENFLKTNNLKYEYIELCPFCLTKGEYKEVYDKYRFYGRFICLDCAIEEIRNEININEEFIRKLLKRFGDVEKVMEIFKTNKPLDNPELTRYDVLVGSEEDKIKNYKIDELNIPEGLKEIIKKRGIEELLPVQTLSVKGGLLENKNLLIMSATSSGKTLIGELAGIKNLLDGKGKFLFLVPLVALANQKYIEFKERYEKLGLKVSLRVGMGRLSKPKEEINTDLNADIIVGTYEGIDYLIRTKKLKDVGTVVIDEIHSLNIEDRGARLDGLIGRLRNLFNVQMIYLSATIGNPEELAKKLNAKAIIYNGRPVPLERHIIFAKNEYNKLNLIREIVNREFNTISKYNYRGQSLIFTYSRKRAEYIARFLNSKGIKADFYHGGMEYSRRRKVEDDFLNQKIMCVVTTAALAAGVDFPASTVILESLAMGGDWLNPSEFQQMCGRAGRKGMHDIGKVYLLVEIGKKYHAKMEMSEDEVAFKLLNSEPEDVDVEYNEDEELEQILATITSGVNNKFELDRVPLLGRNLDLNYVIGKLEDYGMVDMVGNNIHPTKYGYATSISFLYPKDAEAIREAIKNKEEIMELIVKILPFDNIYISPSLKNKLSRIFHINIPSRFVDALQIIRENFEKVREKHLKEMLIPIILEFEEEDVIPKISKTIINLRMNKKTPSQISKILYEDYRIQTYSGDIYTYLENVIKLLDAIERIGNIYNKNYAIKAKELKERIENPYQ